jgi:hypothetical protein
MPDFLLTPDQIGDLAPDGSITKHPEQDIFGQPVDRLNPTRKQLTLGGKRIFVVIPVGKDSEDNVYKLAGDKPAVKSKSDE